MVCIFVRNLGIHSNLPGAHSEISDFWHRAPGTISYRRGMEMDLQLTGKVAVITGSGRGIGYASALALSLIHI